MSQLNQKIILIIIILIAAGFRLVGLNWDQGHHLHPDERFLTMTVSDLSWPDSWQQYFDPAQSPLNPRNQNRDFFVYGNWPLTVTAGALQFFDQPSLQTIALTGRVISALADLSIVVVIYLSLQLAARYVNQQYSKQNKQQQSAQPQASQQTTALTSKLKAIIGHPQTKIWASLCYALLVLPIQQAHFFTTDTMANFWTAASFYTSLAYCLYQKKMHLVLTGLSLGLALGSKISAALIIPLNLTLIYLPVLIPLFNKVLNFKANRQFIAKIRQNRAHYFKNILAMLAPILIVLIAAYFGLRFSNPYMFEHASWLKPEISQGFRANLQQLKSWEGETVWFPPAIQWMQRSSWSGLKNLAAVGVGPVITLLAVLGMMLTIKNSWRIITNLKQTHDLSHLKLAWIGLVISFWLIAYCGYYSFQFVQSLRYYLLIYPFLAILAGLAVQIIKQYMQTHEYYWLRFIYNQVMLISLIIWPLMFISIYLKPHTRIQASRWIYDNIDINQTLLVEEWDDALPLRLAGQTHQYQILTLPVFAPDTRDKWQEMTQKIDQGDYYILSSQRGWGSVTRVPEKYPQMSQFYQDLLSGKTKYQLKVEFTSYPSLDYLGIPVTVQDIWAEEAFSVYDHPPVMIFANTSQSDAKH